MGLLSRHRDRRDVRRNLRRLAWFIEAALAPPTDPRAAILTTADLPTVSIEQEGQKKPKRGKRRRMFGIPDRDA
jgi:hypothetical protein